MDEAGNTQSAVSLATPLRTLIAEVDEGGSPLAFTPPARFMQVLTPQVFPIAAFKTMATGKKDPHASQFKLLKGSPLNVRVGGSGDANLVKTMLNMLPNPKLQGPSNPFEEAQW
jgi:2-C-methyl-D-erythritol 4-phosphate cytidylyltransferase